MTSSICSNIQYLKTGSREKKDLSSNKNNLLYYIKTISFKTNKLKLRTQSLKEK